MNKSVKGTVTDDSGAPVPGATVTVVGSMRGVITDMDGHYSIDVGSADKLQFSFVGLESQMVEVGTRMVIDIQLKQQVDELKEVTVVAFAKQKKESVLSSITTVNPAELKVPSSNLTTALAGRIAGLISYQRSGEPGVDNADFFIRGVTSFGYASNPLILIDGLEVSSQDLARMQPDDIASFSIMKDATATALYGARGANGVILVTTKEGKEGKANVSARFETSFSSPTDKIELADPITYMRLHNEAVVTRNPLGVQPYSREKIDNTIAGINPYVYPAVNWYNMLFKDFTVNNRLNFSVSGGGKVARYYVSGTVNQDNGALKVDKMNNFNNNIDLRRYLLHSNVNINITNTTEMIIRMHGAFDDYTGPIDGGSTIYNKIVRASPVLYPPVFLPDESTKYAQHILFGNYGEGNYINPYADMVKGYKDYNTSTMTAQFELKQDLGFIIKGLKARGLFSTTRYSYSDVSRYYNPYYYAVSSYDKKEDVYTLEVLNPTTATEYLNYSEGTKNITTTTYAEAALSYDHSFSEKHEVSGLLVGILRNHLVVNAGSLQESLPYRNLGLSGRVTYSYDKRYFLEANFGYNGSERFAKDHQFGFFPSIGTGWIISNEGFYDGGMKKFMPKLKLKATYGLVGNDQIGSASDRFFFLSEVNMNNSSRQYTTGSEAGYTRNGISVSRYENPDITWEVAKKINLGLEVNLLDVFEINADFFKEHRENILMNRAYIPQIMGLQTTPKANLGEAEGRGVDFSIDFQKSFNKDWWLTSRVNFTYATSEYKVYEEPDYSAIPWKSHKGQKIGQQWGYVADRLFVDDYEVMNSPYQGQNIMAGDIKYKDINNDGKITALDQVPIGYPTVPEIIYGFGFSVGYKGFDISCFFQGLAHESFWIDTEKTAPFIDTDGTSSVVSQNALLKVYADDHWSEYDRNLYALWPRLSNELISNNQARSTWFMQNGSFLRLKSAELGYSLPTELIQRVQLKTARFYVSGTNLLTFSQFKLWDPEMAGNGLGYPLQKVINVGIQITF
ncbi:MAG: SusC/RagA family TonB-linked outer membrane protein [Mangrovibacterium sp.]